MVSGDHNWANPSFDAGCYCFFRFRSWRIHHGNQTKKCQMILMVKVKFCNIRNFPISKCKYTQTLFGILLILQLNTILFFQIQRNNAIFRPDSIRSLQQYIHSSFYDQKLFFPRIRSMLRFGKCMQRCHHFTFTVKGKFVDSWIFYLYF